MKDFGSTLKKLRISKKLTQSELAEKLNEKYGTKLNKGMISKWENNKEEPRMDSIRCIVNFFNVSLDEMLGLLDKKTKSSNKTYHYFPVSVSAGLPIGIEPIETAETITIPDELLGKWAGSKDIYFTRVNGESMNKVFPHNSLIAVKQVEFNNLKNGDIVVYSNGYDYAVKRFYQFQDKIIFKPESTDPIFTDYIIDIDSSENLRLHGKVVTYIVNLD